MAVRMNLAVRDISGRGNDNQATKDNNKGKR